MPASDGERGQDKVKRKHRTPEERRADYQKKIQALELAEHFKTKKVLLQVNELISLVAQNSLGKPWATHLEQAKQVILSAIAQIKTEPPPQ